MQNWDDAREDLNRLKAYIDNNVQKAKNFPIQLNFQKHKYFQPFETELELLNQRAWWIHWSLFIFFNHPKGRDDIIDMFLMNSK